MRDNLINQWVIDGNEPMNRVVDDLPKWHIFFVKNEPNRRQRYEPVEVFANFIANPTQVSQIFLNGISKGHVG
jgi:hypothetical protein